MTHYGRILLAQLIENASFTLDGRRTARSKTAILAHRTVKKRRDSRTARSNPDPDEALREAAALVLSRNLFSD